MFSYKKANQEAEIAPGLVRQVLGAGNKINAVHWDIKDGTVVPPHQHPEEQFGYVIKGGFEMSIGDTTAILEAGDSYFIPAGVPHKFKARGETEAIDVFSPRREAAAGYPVSPPNGNS
jgi:quercetin dioxygenase-like cupin family protein